MITSHKASRRSGRSTSRSRRSTSRSRRSTSRSRRSSSRSRRSTSRSRRSSRRRSATQAPEVVSSKRISAKESIEEVKFSKGWDIKSSFNWLVSHAYKPVLYLAIGAGIIWITRLGGLYVYDNYEDWVIYTAQVLKDSAAIPKAFATLGFYPEDSSFPTKEEIKKAARDMLAAIHPQKLKKLKLSPAKEEYYNNEYIRVAEARDLLVKYAGMFRFVSYFAFKNK